MMKVVNEWEELGAAGGRQEGQAQIVLRQLRRRSLGWRPTPDLVRHAMNPR
jgi:hypothetical protein